jgi:hypothetical protein
MAAGAQCANPVNPATLALLDRRLARILKEHGWSLFDAVSQALAALDVSRKATISHSFDKFRSASAVAQQAYAQSLCTEVALVVQQTQQSLDSEGKSQILQVVSNHLNDDLYAQRFSHFEEAVGRHFVRAGMQVDLTPFRPDIARSLYEVGSKNFVISTIAKLADDLELFVQRQMGVPPQQQPEVKVEPTESKLEQVNRFVKLEPNFFGLGVNLNYLLSRLMGKKE